MLLGHGRVLCSTGSFWHRLSDRTNRERRGNLQSWPRGKRRPRFCGVLCCLDDRSARAHTQCRSNSATWVDGKHRGRRCSQGSHVEEEKGYAFLFVTTSHGVASHYHHPNGDVMRPLLSVSSCLFFMYPSSSHPLQESSFSHSSSMQSQFPRDVYPAKLIIALALPMSSTRLYSSFFI